jgi:uncharacterized membrane protein YedE/YeeE
MANVTAGTTVRPAVSPWAVLSYLVSGSLFGFVAVKSEIVSWYRIQEMFRFDSFHMYGVLGSAVLVAIVSVWIIKRTGARSLTGEPIELQAKAPNYRAYVFGGTLFGLGWALTGACPGPILVLVGSGFPAFLVVLASAVLGTWTYGSLRSRLPH